MYIIPALAAICAIVGVILEMITHDKPAQLLQYFTIQSNLIAGIAALVYLLWPQPIASQFLQASILWMLVTGIIFHTMISKFYKPTGLKLVSNHLTHTFAPLLFFATLFTLNNTTTSPIMWISYPLVYTAFWMVYGYFIDYYPYWFLRPNKPYPEGMGSYTKVFGFVVAMTVGFLSLGSLVGLLN